MRKHKVISVAVVAGCSNNQAGLKKTPAMYALGIIFYNIVFRDIIYPGNNFSLLVAFTAEEGDVHFIGTGIWIRIVQNIVVAMAFFAAGCVRIILQQSLTMDPTPVICHGIRMANTTVYRIQIIRMGKTLISRIRMT